MKTKIKKRKKAKEKECRELMWLGLSSLHPQQKFLNGYIFTIKLCIFYNKPIEG